MRCDSRAAQALPPPSSLSMRSAMTRPSASRPLRSWSTPLRAACPEPSPAVAAVSAVISRRKASPSISSSSFREIFAIGTGWPRLFGGVYSAFSRLVGMGRSDTLAVAIERYEHHSLPQAAEVDNPSQHFRLALSPDSHRQRLGRARSGLDVGKPLLPRSSKSRLGNPVVRQEPLLRAQGRNELVDRLAGRWSRIPD